MVSGKLPLLLGLPLLERASEMSMDLFPSFWNAIFLLLHIPAMCKTRLSSPVKASL